MERQKKSVIRWQGVVGFAGVVAVMLACATNTDVATVTPVPTEQASLRLQNGVVEVLDENVTWSPVGGETTFEITGTLESTEPWMVTGNTFAIRDSTYIDEGLEAGDLVKVRGFILEDAIWLASTIEPTQEQTSPMIILIGKVTSIDPWVVSGITLNLTSDTLISEGITTDMIVRVEILLLEDGTWEVLRIVSLGNFTDVPGCATVTATVASVKGHEIQLVGWPSITLGDEVIIENDQGDPGTLAENQVVLVVICSSEDGQIRVTHIIILSVSGDEIPADGGGEKVLICHKPDKKGGHTLSVSSSAVPAHIAHGDKLGPCS